MDCSHCVVGSQGSAVDAVGEDQPARPCRARVAIDRLAGGGLVVRYRNSAAWTARAFLLALLWVALVVVPPLVWGWPAYRSTVFLSFLGVATLSFLIQLLFGVLSKTGGLARAYVIMVAALAGALVVFHGIFDVMKTDELARFRPAVIGLFWLIGVGFVLHWLAVQFGVGEVRVDRTQCTWRAHRVRLWPSARCRTDRILAIGSRRPRPHLDPNMPRGGLGRLFGWWLGQRPHAPALIGVLVTVCIVSALCALGSTIPLLFAVYMLLLVWMSRTTYPVIVLTRRRTISFGRYLKRDEQMWVAHELRTYMQEIGRPVKRSLYRA
jgi:hypothetical protein